jgi:hypothetical protein
MGLFALGYTGKLKDGALDHRYWARQTATFSSHAATVSEQCKSIWCGSDCSFEFVGRRNDHIDDTGISG